MSKYKSDWWEILSKGESFPNFSQKNSASLQTVRNGVSSTDRYTRKVKDYYWYIERTKFSKLYRIKKYIYIELEKEAILSHPK